MEVKETVKKILNEFSEKKNSHVFLVETDSITNCTSDIKNIIKKILDNKSIDSQIDSESYLELNIVKPDGNVITKDSIVNLQNRLKTKPILSNYMFYIIENGELLSTTTGNKLLKTIEEPNEGIIGFILTTNINQIIPTIKSRCEILTFSYNNKVDIQVDESIKEYANQFIHIVENKDLFDWHNYKKNIDLKTTGYNIVVEINNIYLNRCRDEAKRTINDNFNKTVKISKYLNKKINKLTQTMNSDLLLEQVFINIKKVLKW